MAKYASVFALMETRYGHPDVMYGMRLTGFSKSKVVLTDGLTRPFVPTVMMVRSLNDDGHEGGFDVVVSCALPWTTRVHTHRKKETPLRRISGK